MKDPIVREIELLRVQSGDLLFLRIPEDAPVELVRAARAAFEPVFQRLKYKERGIETLIVSGDIKFHVVRAGDELDEPGAKPIVIGFLGRAGSGKSTATDHVVKLWGAHRTSFAKPLKELAKILYDLTDQQVYGTQAQKETVDERIGISPRTGMIRLGDGARNTLWKSVWIDACFNRIVEQHAEYRKRPMDSGEARAQQIYVIEDVRYPNEVEAITSDPRFHGHVIKLVCPDSDSSGYSNAPSEVSVDEVPESRLRAIIESRKSPDSIDLKHKVDDVVVKLIGEIVRDNPGDFGQG